MNTRFTFLFLFLSLLVLPVTRAVSLEEINTEAYLAMMDADQLLAEDKAAEALAFYQKSLQAYQELKLQDPDFKTQIVDYRIDLLTRKISELTQQLPAEDQGTALTEVEPAEQDFRALYLQTREKMVQDSNRLLALEKRNIQLNATLQSRQQELGRLQAALREMEKSYNELKSEQGRTAAQMEKEVRDLSRFNTLLQERADKLEMESQQLLTQRDELLAEGRELSGDLAVLKREHETLKQELTDLKTSSQLSEQRLILNRNQLQDDLKIREEELSKAQTRLADLEEKAKEIGLLEDSVVELNRRHEVQKKEIEGLQTLVEKSRSETAQKQEELARNETFLREAQSRIAELQEQIAGKDAMLQ
ncbi:MAG: hypothetical protein ACO3N7_01845, partial [Kiritimatiellia bacterium]